MASPPSRWPSAAGAARMQPPPERARRRSPRAWARWRCGRRSATARRRRTAARPGRSTRRNSPKARSRSGRWCSTAWPKTRSKDVVLERQLLGVAGDGRDVEAQAHGVGLQRVEHPGRDVGAHGVAHDAGLQHVQAEVAGAGADLQRALEAAHAAERLGDLAQHLLAADLAVVDAPFGVVAGGGAVVVARVDGADLLRGGGGRGRHGAGVYARVHESVGAPAGPARPGALRQMAEWLVRPQCVRRAPARALRRRLHGAHRSDPVGHARRPRRRARRSSPRPASAPTPARRTRSCARRSARTRCCCSTATSTCASAS